MESKTVYNFVVYFNRDFNTPKEKKTRKKFRVKEHSRILAQGRVLNIIYTKYNGGKVHFVKPRKSKKHESTVQA